jgi:hypothetical protein
MQNSSCGFTGFETDKSSHWCSSYISTDILPDSSTTEIKQKTPIGRLLRREKVYVRQYGKSKVKLKKKNRMNSNSTGRSIIRRSGSGNSSSEMGSMNHIWGHN